MSTELYKRGLEIRRRVLGDEYVDRALANVDAFNSEFQELVSEYCWGKVWGRSALSDQQRSLNNLSMMAALNRPHEFKIHMRGALRNGCSLDEIRDTLLQVAIYCGISLIWGAALLLKTSQSDTVPGSSNPIRSSSTVSTVSANALSSSARHWTRTWVSPLFVRR